MNHLIQLRHALHKFPGIALEETQTAQRIVDFFRPLRPGSFRWSEDFGLFSQVCPPFCLVLAREKPVLKIHEGIYDFPDELIETGMVMFEKIFRVLQG